MFYTTADLLSLNSTARLGSQHLTSGGCWGIWTLLGSESHLEVYMEQSSGHLAPCACFQTSHCMEPWTEYTEGHIPARVYKKTSNLICCTCVWSLNYLILSTKSLLSHFWFFLDYSIGWNSFLLYKFFDIFNNECTKSRYCKVIKYYIQLTFMIKLWISSNCITLGLDWSYDGLILRET